MQQKFRGGGGSDSISFQGPTLSLSKAWAAKVRDKSYKIKKKKKRVRGQELDTGALVGQEMGLNIALSICIKLMEKLMKVFFFLVNIDESIC